LDSYKGFYNKTTERLVALLFQAKTARKKVNRNKEIFDTTDGDKIKIFHSSKI